MTRPQKEELEPWHAEAVMAAERGTNTLGGWVRREKRHCVVCAKLIKKRGAKPLTCSPECSAVNRERVRGSKRKCEECSAPIESRGAGAVTCSPECSKARKDRLTEGKRCVVCGGGRHGRGPRCRTCSPECSVRYREIRASRQKELAKGICVVCGNEFEGKGRVTCQPNGKGPCYKAVRRAKALMYQVSPWCLYTPDTPEDYGGMLDILHKKGYSAGDKKENYRYEASKEARRIQWRDLDPAPWSADHLEVVRQARVGEKWAQHYLGMVEEVEQESTRVWSLKELQRSFKDWLTGDQETMGQEAGGWE